jgi:type IX secretion system PorP/SprF family membrane protein
MKKILIPVVFLMIFMTRMTEGQVPPSTDQYILNPLLINPAYAGGRGSLSIAAFYRKQWAGIKGSPETVTLAADSPLSQGNVGLGFSFVHDKTGVTRDNSISTSYSYTIDAFGGDFSFGLRAGILTTNTKWSDLIVLDPGDELYLTDSKKYILPDFGFGVYLSGENYFGGFSIPRLLSYNFNYEKNSYSAGIDPGNYFFIFTGGYIFKPVNDVKFVPSTMISVSPNRKMLFDINAHFVFSDRMWAGASFRSNKSISGLFQFAISNRLKTAYTYFLDLGPLGRFSTGTHEIMLRFEFLYRADIVDPLIF